MKKRTGHLSKFLFLLLFSLLFSGCDISKQIGPSGYTDSTEVPEEQSTRTPSENEEKREQTDKDFSGAPYQVLNQNQPEFTEKQKKTVKAFEIYSDLDSLGRCGTAFANICKKLMPTKKRGEIGMVKPSGWHTVKYDNVDGKYLYNRCHLIGYQLAGENANEKNLITGTRYLNVEGMLDFENEVAEYVKKTGNHVLYRVTPVFEGDDLVASGVQMEAFSVEDSGKGICFNVFVFNIQPGVEIDYRTGDSHLRQDTASEKEKQEKATQKSQTKQSRTEQKADTKKKSSYVINKNTKKFHLPSCGSVKDTLPKNRKSVHENRER